MSGIGALIGGAVTAAAGIYAQHKANQARKEESELAYSRAQAERDKMNAFNSPAEQVARLRAAGLNPNNAYGASGEMVGNQVETPSYTPSEVSPVGNAGTFDASSMIDSLVSLREQRNKNVLTESQLLLNGTEQELKQSGIRLNDANSMTTLELLDLKKEYYRVQNAVGRASEQEIKNKALESLQRIKESLSNISLNDATIRNLNVQSLVTWLLYPSQKSLNEASAAERRASASYVYEQSQYLGKYFDLASRDTSTREGTLETIWAGLAQNKNLTDAQREMMRDYFSDMITQGYWKMGTQAFLGVLNAGVNVYTRGLSGASSTIGSTFALPGSERTARPSVNSRSEFDPFTSFLPGD